MLVYLCWVMALGSSGDDGHHAAPVVRDAAARMTWDQAVTLLILPGLVALVLGVGDLPLQACPPRKRKPVALEEPAIVTTKAAAVRGARGSACPRFQRGGGSSATKHTDRHREKQPPPPSRGKGQGGAAKHTA